MFQKLFAPGPLMTLPLVSMVLFLLVFAVVALRALRLSRQEVESLAQLPLDDAAPARAPASGDSR